MSQDFPSRTTDGELVLAPSSRRRRDRARLERRRAARGIRALADTNRARSATGAGTAQWRVVRERPPCIRLQPDGKLRGVGALGGVMIAIFLLAVLGWFGVLVMSRDLWGLLGT